MEGFRNRRWLCEVRRGHPDRVTVFQEPPTLTGADPERLARLAGLRTEMAVRRLDAVALTSPENVYYYGGLDHLGYFAFTLLIIPRDGVPVLVTRAMERATVLAQLPWVRHLAFQDGTSPAEVAAAALGELVPAGGTVGVERSGMFFPPALDQQITSAVSHASVTDVTWLLSEQRAVKSPDEIGYIRQAAAISDLAMRAALDAALVTPVTDAQVAARALHAMVEAGGQIPGFVPLVRPTTALDQEHTSWTGRRLTTGDGLFVELSGCVRRYHAPLSRTVYLGSPPPGADRAHAAALAGLRAAQRALRPGTVASEVYAAWQRAVTGRAGERTPLRHHCGYLVGIGYPPSWVGGGEVLGIRADSPAVIRAGMTFHLMSWITEPVGHVLSDTVLVTEDGCEPLTCVPHTPVLPAAGRQYRG